MHNRAAVQDAKCTERKGGGGGGGGGNLQSLDPMLIKSSESTL